MMRKERKKENESKREWRREEREISGRKADPNKGCWVMLCALLPHS
jgi:hypothetical protein